MPTIKFDRILQEFSRRIGDRLDSAFTPGTMAFPDGTVLDAVDAIAYVNKALHSFHGDAWMKVGGQKESFVMMFPELVSDFRAITFTAGKYTIANPNLDYFQVFNGYVPGVDGGPNVPARISHEENLALLKTGNYPRHGPTVDKPIVCPAANVLYVFPDTITTVNLQFIIQPLDRVLGGFITQNGDIVQDSPFANNRNSQIAAMAERLYWNEKNPQP